MDRFVWTWTNAEWFIVINVFVQKLSIIDKRNNGISGRCNETRRKETVFKLAPFEIAHNSVL